MNAADRDLAGHLRAVRNDVLDEMDKQVALWPNVEITYEDLYPQALHTLGYAAEALDSAIQRLDPNGHAIDR